MTYAATVTLSGVRSDESFLTRKFELNQACPTLLIGRSSSRRQHDRASPESANAYFTCPVVSRKHAELSLNGGLVRIKDLGSLHGTAVNGTKCSPDRAHGLLNNDIVSVGSTILEGPQKHFAVVFQVHIVYRVEKPTEPAKVTSFVDLSTPIASPTAAAVKPVPAVALPAPSSEDATVERQRETFVVPELDSPENSSDLDDDGRMINGVLDIEAPTPSTKISALLSEAAKGDRDNVDTIDSFYDLRHQDEEEQDEEEEDIFTPDSSSMSSPPSSPVHCDAGEASEEESLESQAKENSEAINARFTQGPDHLGGGDTTGYPARFQNRGGPRTFPTNGEFSWEFPPGQFFAYRGMPSSAFDTTRATQNEGVADPGNEYHSFFPVHGLTQASAPVSAAWAPSASLSSRMYSDPLGNQDAVLNPLPETCSTLLDVGCSLKAMPRHGAVKDAVMSIDNIVSKDATPNSAAPESQGPLKRKAAALDDDPFAKAAAAGTASLDTVQLASTASDLDRGSQDGANKKIRLEEMEKPNTSTNVRMNTSKTGGLKQFALGAIAGGVGVLGALIFLPDSVFF